MKLNDIKPFYFAGVPPVGRLQNILCKIMDAKTFHWLVFVKPIKDENGKMIDWVTSETIDTGTDITRLAGRHVRAYRIKSDPVVDPLELIDIHSEYGALPYNMGLNILTGTWFIATHYLHKAFPVIKPKSFNCVTWVDIIAGLKGFELVPDNQYVTEKALEESPLIEYLGEVNE